MVRVVGDLQGRFCERVVAHVLSSSPGKIRLILIDGLVVLRIVNLELEIIDALMVEEFNLLATVQVRDNSTHTIDVHLIVVLDQLADTQNGYLHFHVIECDSHMLTIDRALNSDFTKFVEEAATGCLSDFLLVSLSGMILKSHQEFLKSKSR